MSDDELALLGERLRRMQARRDRERVARQEAERLLEEKSLELWTANKHLEAARADLEMKVERRTQELSSANAHLQKAMVEAQQASRAREAFMATMSHEIRTPMNGVLGLARLLRNTSLSQEQEELLWPLVDSAESLLRILDDVLDWSSIAAGGLTLQTETYSPRALVSEVARLYQGTAKSAGTVLDVTIDASVPEWVRGDGGRVRQVLRNLVGNAVKFAAGGGVRIVSSRRDDRLVWEVRDNGPGMTPDQVDKVFDAFTQADNQVRRRFGGTGLGLSISDALVKRMGGTLRCESELGVGSTFLVELPLVEAIALQPEVASVEWKVSGLRVLVVDDHAVNRLVARRYLESMDAKVYMADGGPSALEVLGSVDVDLVMTDLHMPEIDGVDLTRRIRAGEGRARHVDVPVIGLSADVMPERRAACVDAGMCAFLAKPFKREELIELLSPWARDPGRGEQAAVSL